jgi:uncharacterized membrane protein YqjE
MAIFIIPLAFNNNPQANFLSGLIAVLVAIAMFGYNIYDIYAVASEYKISVDYANANKTLLNQTMTNSTFTPTTRNELIAVVFSETAQFALILSVILVFILMTVAKRYQLFVSRRTTNYQHVQGLLLSKQSPPVEVIDMRQTKAFLASERLSDDINSDMKPYLKFKSVFVVYKDILFFNIRSSVMKIWTGKQFDQLTYSRQRHFQKGRKS